jgi:Tfp pilus assembly protein FimT
MITVLIIGILSAVVVPRFLESVDMFRAEAAATRVAADLKFARRTARTSTSEETVTFDTAGDKYAFSSAKDLDHPGQVRAVDLSRSPYRARLVTADFNGAAQVTFNAYGVPNAGGYVTVRSGDHERTVVLDAGTGRASVP